MSTIAVERDAPQWDAVVRALSDLDPDQPDSEDGVLADAFALEDAVAVAGGLRALCELGMADDPARSQMWAVRATLIDCYQALGELSWVLHSDEHGVAVALDTLTDLVATGPSGAPQAAAELRQLLHAADRGAVLRAAEHGPEVAAAFALWVSTLPWDHLTSRS